MFRPICAEDRETYRRFVDDFYHSDAVWHPVPAVYYERTFALLMQGSPYTEGFIAENADGEPIGYALLSKTYSQEAGGLVVWLEELYFLPEYRGRGCGSRFFDFLKARYAGKAARFRLEVEPENRRAQAMYERMGFSTLPYGQMLLETPCEPKEGF